jgi:hypothetical protein
MDDVFRIHEHHDPNDWCHICGERNRGGMADVWYPQNAEHTRIGLEHKEGPRYIRICWECSEIIHLYARCQRLKLAPVPA